MRVVSPETALLDRFEVVVDPDAEPADLDRFLDALDRLVERRLAQRKHSTSAGTPAAERSISTTGE
jgi:hypothetical protein